MENNIHQEKPLFLWPEGLSELQDCYLVSLDSQSVSPGRTGAVYNWPIGHKSHTGIKAI